MYVAIEIVCRRVRCVLRNQKSLENRASPKLVAIRLRATSATCQASARRARRPIALIAVQLGHQALKLAALSATLAGAFFPFRRFRQKGADLSRSGFVGFLRAVTVISVDQRQQWQERCLSLGKHGFCCLLENARHILTRFRRDPDVRHIELSGE